jgi:hypothetical protein
VKNLSKNVNYQRANELKEVLQLDIEALLQEAEGADLDEQRLPAQIAHHEKFVSKMDEAIEGLKKPAEAQQHADQNAYEKNISKREAKAEMTGKKVPGREPKEPKDVEEIALESKATYNLTAPDSRVMRKSKHAAYTQRINARASVDAQGSYLILGQHLSLSSSDAKFQRRKRVVARLPQHQPRTWIANRTDC